MWVGECVFERNFIGKIKIFSRELKYFLMSCLHIYRNFCKNEGHTEISKPCQKVLQPRRLG